ncbi:hypothetical protein [Apibacter adventoris]|nr:hypothetical protein [Apibacter adventoris]
MKKFSLVLCVFLGSLYMIKAQSINDIPIKNINTQYIQIVGTSKAFSDKVNVEIDFGQIFKNLTHKNTSVIKNSKGEEITFDSMIDALNFMYENGFEFIDSFITVGSQNIYHYILKRKE